MKRKNYFMISLIVVGAILFGVVAFVVIRANRTVNAIVPNQTIAAGTRITNDMLSTIQVPVNTPTGYITDRSSLLGQKLRINAQPGQFMYVSDVMTSWDDVVFGVSVPDDYIITAIMLENERAVGGLITSGDTIDIFAVSGASGQQSNQDPSIFMNQYGDVLREGYITTTGCGVYPVLANVNVLETDSTLSSSDNGMLSGVTGDGGSDGAYYVVALSYSDYMKYLYVTAGGFEMWACLSPTWNNDHDPLLDLMRYPEITGLMDAQAQSIIEEVEDGGEIVKRFKDGALESIAERRQQWMDENGYEYVDQGGGITGNGDVVSTGEPVNGTDVGGIPDVDFDESEGGEG